MTLVFFLRHFNDVDHISPIIWECVEQDDDVLAVLLDTAYPNESDPRLQFLNEYDNFESSTVDDFLDISWGDEMFKLQENDTEPSRRFYRYLRRLLQKTSLSNRYAVPALRNVDPTACVFEWGPPLRTSHAEFYLAAQELDIPTLSVPHGAHIYTHIDIKPFRARAAEEGRQIMASRNGYDAYVEQSPYHKESNTVFGINPKNHYLIGSARYYPEWQSINEEFYDRYTPKEQTGDRLNVVFMLPHWNYHVDKEKTTSLLSELAAKDWLYLVIKDHTRGDSLPPDVYETIAEVPQAEIIADVASVSLIKWSDVVVNFGSSIGVEAFLQGKDHLYPAHLHSNNTVFDKSEAGYHSDSNAATVQTLKTIHKGEADPVSAERVQELYQLMIYGGKEEFDVLQKYRELIRSQANGGS